MYKKEKTKVIFNQADINLAVDMIGKRIAYYLNEQKIEKMNSIIVMNGGFHFGSDVIMAIGKDINVNFARASSYGNSQKSFGEVQLSLPEIELDLPILVIDDIYDTGLTMETIKRELKEKGAKKIITCTFLKRKGTPNKPDFYCHLVNSDDFVYGYGLDFKGKFRNIKAIMI